MKKPTEGTSRLNRQIAMCKHRLTVVDTLLKTRRASLDSGRSAEAARTGTRAVTVNRH